MTMCSDLGCKCGSMRMQVRGPHIAVVECLCGDCHIAADQLEKLDGVGSMTNSLGATPYVMHRKDRITITQGQEHLRNHRIRPDATTRRVIASCCNTPMYMEMKDGHWLSIYAKLWPDEARPELEMRTMTGKAPTQDQLPNDVPNLNTHNLSFYWRLFVAWAAMRFRNPEFKVDGDLRI